MNTASLLSSLLFLIVSCPAALALPHFPRPLTLVEASPVERPEREEVTFLVSMTCQACQRRIEEKMAFEKGVKKIKVDLNRKTVTIAYDPRKTTPDALRDALRKLGYTVAKAPSSSPKPPSAPLR